jgi:hypothetical protein
MAYSDEHWTTARVTILHYCDYCEEEGVKRVAVVDGATKQGPWADMCSAHFMRHGVGLGTGIGQTFIYEDVEGEPTFKEQKRDAFDTLRRYEDNIDFWGDRK